MIEEKDIILFERSLAGRLSDDEQQKFDERLTAQKQFKSNFEKYKAVIKTIGQHENYQDLMVLLNENFKSQDWSVPPPVRERQQRFWIHWAITITLILLAVLLTWWFTRGEAETTAQSTKSEVSAESSSERTDQSNSEPAEVAANQIAVDSIEQQELEVNDSDNEVLTAFMIGDKGYFLTQYSTISDARFLRLRQNDTLDFRAEMVVYDASLDLAVLKFLEGEGLSGIRVPYRLATTQSYEGTAVMSVSRKPGQGLLFTEGTINALESEGELEQYAIEWPEDENALQPGSPLISKNGNVVGIVTSAGSDRLEFIKSTRIVGFLARNANDPELGNYIPTAANRLAGLERRDQVERLESFVLEVVKFY